VQISAIIFGDKEGIKSRCANPPAQNSILRFEVPKPPIPAPQITPTLNLSTVNQNQ